MNIVLWVLQAIAALLFGSSGVMKAFMFDKISHDVPSFGTLPRKVWLTLGVMELVCAVGLVVPGVLHWHPSLTSLAAVVLAAESLLFIWVHIKYREAAPIMLSLLLGLAVAFIAYGRTVWAPLL